MGKTLKGMVYKMVQRALKEARKPLKTKEM